MRYVIAVALTLGLLGIIGATSRGSYRPDPSGDAVLRLSWRTRGRPVEKCRILTDAELQALPPHMRTPKVCEGRIADYTLRVALDGRELPAHRIRAAGAHADRPVFVFRELRVAPGRHRLAVRFTSAGSDDALVFANEMMLESGQLVLITTDPGSGRLVAR